MDFEHEIEITLPIRIAWDDGTPYAEIDAPEPVARWIGDRLGLAGMATIDREVRARVEVERQNNEAAAAEAREEHARYRAMELADYGA